VDGRQHFPAYPVAGNSPLIAVAVMIVNLTVDMLLRRHQPQNPETLMIDAATCSCPPKSASGILVLLFGKTAR
jgi:hypothetical protein